MQRRKQDDQAGFVDILTIDVPPSPTLTAPTASSSRPTSPSKLPLSASAVQPVLTEYDLFAAFEPDDDDQDAFFVPLDYDLEEEEDEGEGGGNGNGRGERVERGVVMGVSGLMTERGERGRGR